MTVSQCEKDVAALFINKGIERFAHEASQARRFHAETLGLDVDPEHSFGDYLQLVAAGNDHLIGKRYGEYCVKSALAESSGVTGGYLVPEVLRDDLMRDLSELAIFRPRATVVPMTSATLELPIWDITTATSKGVPPFWGGVSFSWLSEAAALPENEGKFRQLSLRANLIGGTVVTSAPLLEDGAGLEAWLRQAFARSLAWLEDWHAINGNGAGQPQGVIAAGGSVAVTRTGSPINAADTQSMLSRLYSPQPGNALWLASRTILDKLTAITGWIPNGQLQLHGVPIRPTVLQPAAGTKGDVILIDPSMYVIGDRGLLEISASPYASSSIFTQNQLMWRISERIDGRLILNQPITLPDGAGAPNTVSPVVALN
jgi:HK97 family phage major capsid protein